MNENVTEPVLEVVDEVVVVAPVVKNPIVVETAPVEKEEAIEIEVAADEAVTGVNHDDFMWSIGKRAKNTYSVEDTKRLSDQYEASMSSVGEGTVIRGKVMAIAGGDVVLDVNHKSDGLIPLSEFREDRKSTRLNSVTGTHLVCRLLLEKRLTYLYFA